MRTSRKIRSNENVPSGIPSFDEFEGPIAIVNAIRAGEVDAFVISSPEGDRVYTLGSNEPRYQKLIEEMREGAALLTPAGEVLYCNPHLAALLRTTVGDLIMSSMNRWIKDQHREAFEKCIKEAQHGSVNVELILGSNGSMSFPVMLTASPMHVDGTSVICMIVSDLSLHYQNEKERVARAEAERENRLKDDYMATVSHELRNPLNVIMSWTSTLRERMSHPEVIKLGLDAIERSARAQAKIIDDLLDINRVTAGSLRVELETLDFGNVVRTALESMQQLANDKNIRVGIVTEAVHVSGDPSRLNQVICNILSNAIKFTPNGGSIQISVLQENEQACLRVTDTGRGIDPQFLPHVFERFKQADGSLTRRVGGLGLGLAIARQLVQLHGGQVSAESAGLGKGSMFVVTLPRLAMPDRIDGIAVRPGQGAIAEDQETDLRGTSVLIVDDDPDSCEALRRLLLAHHANVMIAASTREALDKLQRFSPDVLISDIAMPDSDGYDLIQKIRAGEQIQPGRIPAIALTAFARPEDREQALAAGYDRHLTKPVAFPKLVSALKAMTQKESADSTS